jgi:plastocyanin
LKLHAIAIAVLAVLALGACSSDEKVGDESSLAFDQEQADQFGATTSTTEAGVTETTSPSDSTTTEPSNTTLPPEQQEVTIDVAINEQSPYFDPGLVQVQVGSKVRFTNKGTSEHSVTSDTGLFDSGPLAPGAVWIYEASTAGSFNYSDSARPFAVGTIQVS